MKAKYLLSMLLITFSISISISAAYSPSRQIRILVVTGNHIYKVEEFNRMLASLGDNISFQVAELPGAYEMFKAENRSKFDVVVFYHMWQKINEEQAKNLTDCISEGKPLVALHHSICAYDDWPEYFKMIGGKYFHKTTTVNGIVYQPCSYIHDLHFRVKISDPENPVTKGLKDFELFDETYKGFYVEAGVTSLLTTDEQSSGPVLGWTKVYGKARVVTLQCGHDVPTFDNPNFRKLLRQSIEWVYNNGEIQK